MKLVDYIIKKIDGKYTPVYIYIDLSKAFDTLKVDILLHKLHYYGVTGVPLELDRSYITNRKQYVNFKTLEPDYMDVKLCVPQGSILGHLPFSIYINDIVTVSKKLKFLMTYADDTTIYFNLEYLSGINVEENVSNELNKVNSWLSLNKFSLNTEKTKCMTFHTRQKSIDPLTFLINGIQIENVKFFKFLGIMFDEHLTWKNHITIITNKLFKVIGILNRLKNIYLQHALLSIYNALFYPI